MAGEVRSGPSQEDQAGHADLQIAIAGRTDIPALAVRMTRLDLAGRKGDPAPGAGHIAGWEVGRRRCRAEVPSRIRRNDLELDSMAEEARKLLIRSKIREAGCELQIGHER